MSDTGWIYGAAHVRLAFLRGPRLGTKTSPGPGTARLGLNKSPLITGRPQPGPRPAEEQPVPLPVSVKALLEPPFSAQEDAQGQPLPGSMAPWKVLISIPLSFLHL